MTLAAATRRGLTAFSRRGYHLGARINAHGRTGPGPRATPQQEHTSMTNTGTNGNGAAQFTLHRLENGLQ
ncbi:MAG TPA: hypothetical protein VGR57_19585, partial [Ktedonobacterales bacterium]|nr:hypothetical protein [Ktedonobacterales bacterium]